MISQKKVPLTAEKRSQSTPKALEVITSSLSQEENMILKTILKRGLDAQDAGTGSDRGTLEELKVIWKFVEKSKDNNTFALCEWCQKVFILGESIRGIHYESNSADKFRAEKTVHYGKPAVLEHLTLCIDAGEKSLKKKKDQHVQFNVQMPRMGLVRSTGKFESFPQSVVLWCLALERDEAEERVARIVGDKDSWLDTMVERLRLQPGCTVKDVQEYLDKEKPRFLHLHPRPSQEDIKFWIRVAGPTAAHRVPVSISFRQNLDAIVDRLGKRLTATERRQKSCGPKSSSESDRSSNSAELKVPKKPGPTFQSALSAISKKNGGRQNRKVVDEKDPDNKMKMILRRLGGTEPALPPGDWTAGINENILSERFGAVSTFISSFGVSLPVAVQLLSSVKASKPVSRKKKGTPEQIYCFPGPSPKVNKQN